MGWIVRQNVMSTVIRLNIDLEGKWKNAGDPGSQRFVIALRMSIRIDRPAFGLDPANGIMINGSKINVSFQDCGNITGTLEPNTIR